MPVMKQVFQDPERRFLQLLERVHLMMDDHRDAMTKLRELEGEIREAIEIVKDPARGAKA